MTTKERMMCVYRNCLPDKIPVAAYGGFFSRNYYEKEAWNMGFGTVESYPLLSSLGVPMRILPGYVPKIKGAEFSIKYVWDNGKLIERNTIETPVGCVYQENEQAMGAGSRHVRKYYVTKPEDYKIIQYIMENTVYVSNEPQIKNRIAQIGEEGILYGRIDRTPYQKLLVEVAGAEQFLVDLYTEPEIVEELIQVMSHRMIEYFSLVAESSVDAFWSPENITADLTPPENFKKYCVPFYREFNKIAKQTGKPYVIHMDGHIKPLKEFISAESFDVIESFSYPSMGGDMTFDEAHNAFDNMVILPNFPSNICLQTDEEIKGYLDEMIGKTRGKIPFMFFFSEDLPADQYSRIFPLVSEYVARNG